MSAANILDTRIHILVVVLINAIVQEPISIPQPVILVLIVGLSFHDDIPAHSIPVISNAPHHVFKPLVLVLIAIRDTEHPSILPIPIMARIMQATFIKVLPAVEVLPRVLHLHHPVLVSMLNAITIAVPLYNRVISRVSQISILSIPITRNMPSLSLLVLMLVLVVIILLVVRLITLLVDRHLHLVVLLVLLLVVNAVLLRVLLLVVVLGEILELVLVVLLDKVVLVLVGVVGGGGGGVLLGVDVEVLELLLELDFDLLVDR